jgi:hypothetical protein
VGTRTNRRLKKKEQIYNQESEPADQENQRVEYVQNAEQKSDTLWKRIQRNDIFLARDRITREFSVDRFDGIINMVTDEKTKQFMEDFRKDKTRISTYTDDELEHFAYYIYESRKNQLNNAA